MLSGAAGAGRVIDGLQTFGENVEERQVVQ
jgi:hypothetical protein